MGEQITEKEDTEGSHFGNSIKEESLERQRWKEVDDGTEREGMSISDLELKEGRGAEKEVSGMNGGKRGEKERKLNGRKGETDGY